MKKIGILFWDEKRFARTSHEMNKNLIYSVEEAGGLAIGIPSVMEDGEMDEYLSYADGIILTGGSDIAPFLYGEDPIEETGELNLARDKSEYKFVRKIFDHKKPTLAICRGMQMANIVLGGDLYQDLGRQKEDSLVHVIDQNTDHDFKRQYHRIDIEEDSHLYKCLGPSHIVNSYHHQAIRKLASGLRPTAKSKDGIIEAVEAGDDHFFIGVQFHPEFADDSQDFTKIFSYFVGGLN